MKLVDRVREFLDEKCQLLSTAFYVETLNRIEEVGEEQGIEIESPIEQLFWIEWYFRQSNNPDYECLYLIPQYKDKSTGRYRLDFSVEFIQDALGRFGGPSWDEIISSINSPKVGIELDSHIWHEKTKEQAQKDKERERFLISKGWKLVRFAGSEIYKDPPKCVQETFNIVNPIRDKYFNEIEQKHKEGKVE